MSKMSRWYGLCEFH